MILGICNGRIGGDPAYVLRLILSRCDVDKITGEHCIYFPLTLYIYDARLVVGSIVDTTRLMGSFFGNSVDD